MIWQGTSLIDAPFTAAFANGELVVGQTRLRLVSEDPTDVRAVAPDGAAYRLHKAGLTVARYLADCDGRAYSARRTGGKRREITDAAGRVIARTRGRADGSLDITVSAVSEGVEPVDLAFITWGLTYVDTPTRRTRR
ncbi:hypothetical protein [Corynebacterium sp.]|uniref:hypothetical protein n=1 Tax=Corynebacterium sp. TaxID=1720 RepID=UPI002A91E06F|nr:hypothetical protein [Corynebacterium sp.]MDY5785752.1 hypothetical protein [Corynebacterium sp.]